MNRRNFLFALAAAPIAPYVPAAKTTHLDLLGTMVASNTASLDFTNIAVYDEYLFVMTSTDQGCTWIPGSDYKYTPNTASNRGA